MGACFNDMTLDGKMTKEAVLAKFNERCEQDGYESGHSYSGTFSQFSGLRFTGKEFDTMDAAHDWVEEHGEKWGPAVCVRHKKYDMPKSALNHDKARRKLQQNIWNAEAFLGSARRKAQINNRSSKPAYVTKAEVKLEIVKAKNQMKIDDRTAKIEAIIAKTATKSKTWVWYLGGLCSS